MSYRRRRGDLVKIGVQAFDDLDREKKMSCRGRRGELVKIGVQAFDDLDREKRGNPSYWWGTKAPPTRPPPLPPPPPPPPPEEAVIDCNRAPQKYEGVILGTKKPLQLCQTYYPSYVK